MIYFIVHILREEAFNRIYPQYLTLAITFKSHLFSITVIDIDQSTCEFGKIMIFENLDSQNIYTEKYVLELNVN